MLAAKQVADFITISRAGIAVSLVWLGAARGAEGLRLAALLMIADWMGDALDGRIARRSRIQYHTWIGDHDLEVDMVVSIGLLMYMMQAGFTGILPSCMYLLLSGIYFWRQRGIPHSPGMLFQAPIYGWFIWLALREAPLEGWAIVAFIAAAVTITWPYFPRVMIPGFLEGMRIKR